MNIKTGENKEKWDLWLKKNSLNAPFTQSFEWGEILLKEGKKVERLMICEGEVVLGQALVHWASLPFGLKYAFCPRGPVIVVGQDEAVMKTLTAYLKKQGGVFLRIEPEWLPNKLSVKKTIDINPATTTIITVTGGKENWLNRMRKNTRYSIRQSLKNNLLVKAEKNLEIFWKLLNITAQRDDFKTHSKKHYEMILHSQSVYQLTAYHENVPVATAAFVRFGDTLTYLFAASDHEWHKLSAPYLLQLEALRLAEKIGCTKYDMFGIAPPLKESGADYEYDQKHHYAKITLFKLGFGGKVKTSPGTYDIILKAPRFYFYKLVRALRRLI
ncbi:MAG: peptidoglycan bridge formation glycyltransferase FemA/FemB family protein [bacterium]|nr:peptidoglycan bridge formation glycyltransferase FemA/FemB family protein [bacterium]